MTRTITTADLAPLVTRHGADFETSKWTVELGFPASEPVSIHSWQADLLAAIPSAPAVPVVSDAAVEAAARAMYFEDCGVAPSAEAMAGEDYDARFREYARAALSAALPHLGAAPSATREDVARALDIGGWDTPVGLPDGPMASIRAYRRESQRQAADRLLARFTITPRADR